MAIQPKTIVIWTMLFLGIVSTANGISRKRIYPHMGKIKNLDLGNGDVGEPLILTPLINSGQIEEGQRLSLVTNLTDTVSYSGFFTVNPKYNSNMFFWYFPAVFHPEKAPVLVWLQGGPGGSSLFGLFTENGPFIIDEKMEVLMRSTSWSFTHNLVYFDNPVGTGFSFTEDDLGFARSEDDVARDLYSAITQFLTLFPDLAKKDFYISGESYAGKYVPAISHKIHVENQGSPALKINLKGIAIGDGFTDPVNMLNWGDYLHNVGLLNLKQKEFFEMEEEKARNYIKSGRYGDAFDALDNLLDGDLVPYPSYYKNATGLDAYFNILMDKEPKESEYYATFVQLPSVRKSIHVGKQNYSDLGGKVERLLREDMYTSQVKLVADLLDAKEKYQVLFYNGQLDVICAGVLTENFLKNMKWHGSADWGNVERKIWRVGGDVAGYATVLDNLTFLVVRKAGHMVPADQPKWAFDMINRFTYRKPYAQI